MAMKDIPDEELLLLIRMGKPGAQETLFKRYFDLRSYHVHRAVPSIGSHYDQWEMNSDYFQVFWHCENTFEFGQSLFKNYFETALRHEIHHEIAKKNEIDYNCMSLDDPLGGSEDLTFHDVCTSGGGEDPRLYLNYLEEAYRLKKAPDALTEDILDVAVLRGEELTFPEIAKRLQISIKMAKDRYSKYEKIVERIVNHGNLDGFYKKAKKNAKSH